MKLLQGKASLLAIALLICTQMAMSQIDINLKVVILGTTDSSEALHFGMYKTASYCIFSHGDSLLGENELPFVPPPGIADYRFVNPQGPDTACFGNGTFRDYRNWEFTSVTDTFEIDLQTSTGGTGFRISWPAGLSTYFSSCIIQDAIVGFRTADMLTAAFLSSNGTLINKFLIICQPIPNSTDVKLDNNIIPNKFVLNQNYPNPFNPSTTITFAIQKAASAQIVIYDVLGRKVRTLASERLVAGSYSTLWNGLDDHGNAVGSGVYYARLLVNDASSGEVVFSAVRKLLLAK